MSSLLPLLVKTLLTFIMIYNGLLLVRILLSWFPSINWFDPPFSILSQITDPYLNIFRNIIPPLGGLDFSPMLALLLLYVVQQVVEQAAMSLGVGAF